MYIDCRELVDLRGYKRYQEAEKANDAKPKYQYRQKCGSTAANPEFFIVDSLKLIS